MIMLTVNHGYSVMMFVQRRTIIGCPLLLYNLLEAFVCRRTTQLNADAAVLRCGPLHEKQRKRPQKLDL